MFMDHKLSPSGVVCNTKKGFHRAVFFGLNSGMDMQAIRRANLKRMFREISPDDVTGFGRVIGKSQSATSDLLLGRKSFGEKMARSIEKNAGWVSMSLDMVDGAENTSPGPDITGSVPLISWVQAGAFCGVVDVFQPGDAEDWIPSVQRLGPHAYALRVQGDSMTAPHGRSYPDGVIVFVDPDTAVTNGCRVIVKIPSSDEATFKQYVELDGRKYLKPLNPAYPTIEMTDGMLICGVVRGSFMPE